MSIKEACVACKKSPPGMCLIITSGQRAGELICRECELLFLAATGKSNCIDCPPEDWELILTMGRMP